jgi:hypothetical protein
LSPVRSMTSIISHGMYGTGGRGPPRRRREPSRVTAAPCLQCYGAEVVASPAERRRRSATGRSGRQPAWSGAASSRRSTMSRSLGPAALTSAGSTALAAGPGGTTATSTGHSRRTATARGSTASTHLAGPSTYRRRTWCRRLARTETCGVGKLALRFFGIRWLVGLHAVREAIRRRRHPRRTARQLLRTSPEGWGQ